MSDADTKKLTSARTDAKAAVRDLTDAIETEGPDRAYHLGQAVQRLDFAISALRAVQKAAS